MKNFGLNVKFQLVELVDVPSVPTEDDDIPRASVRDVQTEYYRYFNSLSRELIWDVPMSTFEKTRYALGDKLELWSKGKRPPSRGFLTVNAKRIAMIATRLGQTGEYSEVEEELEAKAEKEMVHPAATYGAAVNVHARTGPESMDEAIRYQVYAAQAIRDVSLYGDASLYSGKFFSLVKIYRIVINF